MKILFITPDFFPSVGGVEQMVEGLAKFLEVRNHDITVLTRTNYEGLEPFKFRIIRDFSQKSVLQQSRKCDLAVYFNLSLKNIAAFFFTSVPLIVVHGGLYRGVFSPLKKWISFIRSSAQISCSEYVARHFLSSRIINNFYQDDVFIKDVEHINRKMDLVFLGRLVPEKGCDVLLKAIHQLSRWNIKPSVLIIGSGPEESNLKMLCDTLSLQGQVSFLGQKTKKELAKILNQCKTMVIPTIIQEGFGLVALEGIACGCLVIGSSEGGLKEAIGPCGITFPNGNANALATLLKTTLTNPGIIEFHQKQASEHLKKFQQEYIAERYLSVFNDVLSKRQNI